MKTGSFLGKTDNINNLKLVVNAAANKLDIFSRSGGAVPDASNPIFIAIPDGNGNVYRRRDAAYLSGTSQFIMADAANYWSKGSLDAEIKTAWVYAIWDGTGIVWALGGYSGFNMVPTTTTVTDDDYFLLEESSTYSRSNSHYCVAVAKIRYQYDTADTPDHTIQATVIDAPQVIWNPKSDYERFTTLATQISSEANIADYSVLSFVVKQSGKYLIMGNVSGTGGVTYLSSLLTIKTGSSTYGSATTHLSNWAESPSGCTAKNVAFKPVLLNAGDTIHLGAAISSAGGTRYLVGDNAKVGATALGFTRID